MLTDSVCLFSSQNWTSQPASTFSSNQVDNSRKPLTERIQFCKHDPNCQLFSFCFRLCNRLPAAASSPAPQPRWFVLSRPVVVGDAVYVGQLLRYEQYRHAAQCAVYRRLLLFARLVDGHLCRVRRRLLLPCGLVVGVPDTGADRFIHRGRRCERDAVLDWRLLRRRGHCIADAVYQRILLRDRRPERAHRAVCWWIFLPRGRLVGLERTESGHGLGRRRVVRRWLLLSDWQPGAGRVPNWILLRRHGPVARHAVHAGLLLRHHWTGRRADNAVRGRVLLSCGRHCRHAASVPGGPLLPCWLGHAHAVRGPGVPCGRRVDCGQYGVRRGLLLPRLLDLGAAGRVPVGCVLPRLIVGAHAVHAGLCVHDGDHVVGHRVAVFRWILLPVRLVVRDASAVPAGLDVSGHAVGAHGVHDQQLLYAFIFAGLRVFFCFRFPRCCTIHTAVLDFAFESFLLFLSRRAHQSEQARANTIA